MKIEIMIDRAIEAMEKNLVNHIVEYKEATKGWTKQAIEALKELKDAVDRKGVDAANDTLWRLFQSKPVDNRKKYAKYISALKQAKAAGQIKLESDEDEVDMMFNDNWSWAVSGKVSNSAYTMRR